MNRSITQFIFKRIRDCTGLKERNEVAFSYALLEPCFVFILGLNFLINIPQLMPKQGFKSQSIYEGVDQQMSLLTKREWQVAHT